MLHNSRREELSPAQIRDKKTTYTLFSKSRRPYQLLMCRKAPWRSERKRASPHSKWCQTIHKPRCWIPSWLRDVCTHGGGPWDKPNTNSDPGKVRWLARGNPEEMPHKSDSNYHEGVTLIHPCVDPHVLFFPPQISYNFYAYLSPASL